MLKFFVKSFSRKFSLTYKEHTYQGEEGGKLKPIVTKKREIFTFFFRGKKNFNIFS